MCPGSAISISISSCGRRCTMKQERMAELERRIADLKARLPRHSVPPAMLQELESLEEELEQLVQESEGEDETGRA